MRQVTPPALNFSAGTDPSSSAVKASGMSLSAYEPGPINSAQYGEKEAFLRLFQAHSKSVHSMSRRLMESEAAAENLTRDVFIETFQRLHSIRDEGAFAAFVRRSVTEKAMKRILETRASPIEFKPSITTDIASAEPEFSI